MKVPPIVSKQRELPKALAASNPGPAVGVVPQSGESPAGLPAEVPTESPRASQDAGDEPRPDAPSETVEVSRQRPVQEGVPNGTRLRTGTIRTDSGVEISTRPDNSVPYVFPAKPTKVETLRRGTIRSTM